MALLLVITQRALAHSRALKKINRELAERSDALAREIEERKQAEAALQRAHDTLEQHVAERTAELRQSEERFRTAQELSPDGFSILRPVRDHEGRVMDFAWIYANAATERMVGMRLAALPGRSLLELFPGYRGSPFLETCRQVAETGQTCVEESLYQGDGVLTHGWFRIAVVSMGQDIAVLSQDITERKQAEQELERMRNLLAEGQRVAHVGSFEYVAATRTTVWSEEEYRIYGLDPAGPSPAYDVMLAKCIHPDDAALLHQTFSAAMQSNSVYELEHRIVRPDGSVRWVYDRALPYFDDSGKLLRYVGATLDITERKQAEEALRESEEKYRNLFENMTEEVHFWKLVRDEQGRITTWRLVDANPPTLKTWGRSTIEEIRGKTTDEIFGPGATEHYRPVVEKIMTEGVPHSFEDYFPNLDKHFRFTSVPLGEYFITTGADITAIKKAQEALRAVNESLEQRVAERTAEVQRQADQLRALAAELTQAEQRERKRLAKILHDHIQQLLVAARMQVEWMQRDSRPERLQATATGRGQHS